MTEDNVVEEGVLLSTAGVWYPVVNYVPILLDFAHSTPQGVSRAAPRCAVSSLASATVGDAPGWRAMGAAVFHDPMECHRSRQALVWILSRPA